MCPSWHNEMDRTIPGRECARTYPGCVIVTFNHRESSGDQMSKLGRFGGHQDALGAFALFFSVIGLCCRATW